MNKVNQFNDLYNIDVNKNRFKFITADQMEARKKHQLSGKPQKIWKDIIKRYFLNKFNIIFTLILLALLIMIFVVPITSNYDPKTPVSNATTERIRLIRPNWMKDWNHINDTFSLDDFFRYYNTDNFGPFDKADLLRKPIDVFDSAGKIAGKDVLYINNNLPETFLGTDTIGRDVWSRLFKGAQWSLALAVVVASIETIIGTIVGIYIGFHVGSKIDTLSMRIVEIFNSVPALLWLIIFSMLIGTSFAAMMAALIFVGWVGPLYVARMYTLKVKDSEFIKAAQSIGVSKKGRLFRHVFPNIVGRLLVSFVHRIPAVIFFETTLVFLNVKVGGKDALSIGNIISDARSIEVINSNIMYTLSICSFLLLFTVSLQIIANGIRDAFDPKTSTGDK